MGCMQSSKRAVRVAADVALPAEALVFIRGMPNSDSDLFREELTRAVAWLKTALAGGSAYGENAIALLGSRAFVDGLKRVRGMFEDICEHCRSVCAARGVSLRDAWAKDHLASSLALVTLPTHKAFAENGVEAEFIRVHHTPDATFPNGIQVESQT